MKRVSQPLMFWFLVLDTGLTVAAWVGAYYLRFLSGWIPLFKPTPDFELCLQHLPLLIVLAPVAYHLTGMYHIHRLRRFREELVSVIKGTGLLLLLMLATVFYQHHPYESRITMALFWLLSLTWIVIARRGTWQTIRALRRQGLNQAPALIVGTGRAARRIAAALERAAWTGVYPVGFVEDQPSRWTSDLNIVGTTAELPELIEKHRVQHVFIALPLNRYHEARRVFNLLSQTLVEVRLVLDNPSMAALTLTTTNLEGLTIVGLRESPHFGLNVVVKRAMDIVLSAIALIVLSPVMVVIAVLVKLTSPGPVFYRQERCGLNGKPFRMYKFRTMTVDAEKATGPVWARPGDNRRTRFGAWLRRWSLDELPQLINVLKGDMSLVGPRPERPVFIQQFRRTIPNYMARHCVKAGITGWAQVHGWRGNTSLRKRVQFDLYYITHWNPWLDLHILALTLTKTWFHKNAY